MEVFAEVGIGNETFFSTEFEDGENEYRLPKFVKPKIITGYYLRLWLLKRVFILSTNEGFKTSLKEKNKFKLLFGISGRE